MTVKKISALATEVILKVHSCGKAGLISVPGAGGPHRLLQSLQDEGLISHQELPQELKQLQILVGHAREVRSVGVNPTPGSNFAGWGRYVLTEQGEQWAARHLLTS